MSAFPGNNPYPHSRGQGVGVTHLLSWPTPTAISLPNSLKTINLSSIRCVPRFQLLNLAHIPRTYTHTILGTSHTHTHLAHRIHNPSHNMQGTPSVLPSNATSGSDAVNPAHIPYLVHIHTHLHTAYTHNNHISQPITQYARDTKRAAKQ